MMALLADPAPVVEPLDEVFLVPGTLYCAGRPTRITTVLGSCVAVCLWDRQLQVGAMNHYVLPTSSDGEKSPRYGDVAIDRLYEAMRRHGCRTEDIIAKVFGGANVLPYGENRDTVGDRNIRVAIERLRHHGIHIAARRTGGESGLLVKYDTHTGVAWVRPISP